MGLTCDFWAKNAENKFKSKNRGQKRRPKEVKRRPKAIISSLRRWLGSRLRQSGKPLCLQRQGQRQKQTRNAGVLRYAQNDKQKEGNDNSSDVGPETVTCAMD